MQDGRTDPDTRQAPQRRRTRSTSPPENDTGAVQETAGNKASSDRVPSVSRRNKWTCVLLQVVSGVIYHYTPLRLHEGKPGGLSRGRPWHSQTARAGMFITSGLSRWHTATPVPAGSKGVFRAGLMQIPKLVQNALAWTDFVKFPFNV